MILPSSPSSRYSNLNSSCVTITSPSIPMTSVMLVVRREPSRRRLTWTMISTLSAIWRLMASLGILMSPIRIMFSIRPRHSRGLLACSVHIEPSWPVFIAASRSKHSAPRISPRMIRSGRIRRAFLTRSPMVIAPWPSRLGGRVSSGSQCGCCRRSSAASSIVSTRSPGSIIFDSALSMVVLPEPVPPEMTMFIRHAPAIFSAVHIFSDIEPNSLSMSRVIGFSENLRMEIAVPRSDSGGTITFTREPSLRRASASGVVWSTRRPTWLTMRCAIWNRCVSSRNLIGAMTSLPFFSI